jgi:PIN domain nuclease of toxin-antitoxin system
VRLLLDTHVLIRWDQGAKLSRSADRAIREADQVYVSAVSGWEIAIEQSLGRLRTRRNPRVAVEKSGFEELPIRLRHAEGLADLPWHHRDPFDRLLVAQALAEGLILVTRDRVFPPYKVRLIRA